MRNGHQPAGSAGPPGDLEQLIACEARMATRRAEAAEEARALLSQARTRVQEAEQRAGAALEEAIAALERELELDRGRQLKAIAQDLEQQLRVLQNLSEDRINELARTMLALLIQPTGRDSGS
jgi:hypothetical protein